MDQQKYKSKDRFHWQNGLTVEVQNGDLERALKKLKKKLLWWHGIDKLEDIV